MKLFVINGPNLNMLGIREPAVYGAKTYTQLVSFVEEICAAEEPLPVDHGSGHLVACHFPVTDPAAETANAARHVAGSAA